MYYLGIQIKKLSRSHKAEVCLYLLDAHKLTNFVFPYTKQVLKGFSQIPKCLQTWRKRCPLITFLQGSSGWGRVILLICFSSSPFAFFLASRSETAKLRNWQSSFPVEPIDFRSLPLNFLVVDKALLSPILLNQTQVFLVHALWCHLHVRNKVQATILFNGKRREFLQSKIYFIALVGIRLVTHLNGHIHNHLLVKILIQFVTI